MDPISALLLAMLLASGVTFAGKSAWDNSRKAVKASKAAKIKEATKAAGGNLPKSRRRAMARRHAAGYWSGEILKGFPVARTGWHAGWLAHRTAMHHHKAIREEARTTHLEQQASFLPSLKEHRERQQRARDEILAHVTPDAGKSAVQEAAGAVILHPDFPAPQSAPGTAPADDGWPTGRKRRRQADDAPSPVCRVCTKPASAADPLVPAGIGVAHRSHIERGEAILSAARERRDSSWLRPGETRCPECNGTGANATGDSNCPYCRGWGSADPDPDAPETAPGTICEACGRPGTEADPVLHDGVSNYHRSHAVEAYMRRKGDWVALDPEQPDEDALDEIGGPRDPEAQVRCPSCPHPYHGMVACITGCSCPSIARPASGNDEPPGGPMHERADTREPSTTPGWVQPSPEARAKADRFLALRRSGYTGPVDQDGYAVMSRTDPSGSPLPLLSAVPDNTAPPATGGQHMSETTYSTVIDSAKGSAASAEGNLAAISAERARYEVMADQMTGLEVDSGNLSRVMDIIAGLRKAEQALAGIQDSASALPGALQRDHGQLDEAHASSPVRAAQRQFYGEGQ
jgi:hypothetical protein